MDAWFSIKTKGRLRIADAQNHSIALIFETESGDLIVFFEIRDWYFSGNKIWTGLQEFKFNSKFVMDRKSVLSIHSKDNSWVILNASSTLRFEGFQLKQGSGSTWLYHEVLMSKVKKDSIARSKKNQTWNNEIHVWPFLGFWWVIIWQLVPF